MAVSEIEKTFLVPTSERKELFVRGWQVAVEQFLEDSILDEQEEKRLTEFKERFDLSQSELDGDGSLTRMVWIVSEISSKKCMEVEASFQAA
jgi:hypothetical protein